MLSIEKRNTAYLDWINQCNQYNPEDYLPFFIDNSVLGYIHKDKKTLFNSLSYGLQEQGLLKPGSQKQIFELTQFQGREALTFHPDINDFDKRSQAADDLAKSWYQSGVITSWVGEQYNVNTGFNHKSFFTIERAASSLLGIKKYGVHLNAWVEQQGEVYLWVARRSKDKPTFPGKLDHLVAGGHGAGYRIEETMIKECAEEANIPGDIAQTAKAVSMVSYRMERNQKLQQDNLFIYDLKLEPDFVPQNTDGEAEEFYLWPIEKVLEIVATTQDFKTNCNLVIIDFAVRHGFLHPDEPFYSDICSGLHKQLFFQQQG